jgi:hypothetical protein
MVAAFARRHAVGEDFQPLPLPLIVRAARRAQLRA